MFTRAAVVVCAATVLAVGPAVLAEDVKLSAPKAATDAIRPADVARAGKLINDGLRFLLSRQETDGGWSMSGGFKPALTAMVLKALVQHPDFDTQSPAVQRGFKRMLKYRRADGGIYDPRTSPANYTTAVAIMAMTAARDPKFAPHIRSAAAFLKGQQIAPGSESPDGTKVAKDSPMRGGVSYGRHGRPDLSNMGMWLQALHDAGVPADDPHIQEALIFISRCQNRSESNPLPYAKQGGNDGGFIYAPALRGKPNVAESKAGAGPGGRGLRSYGSMTYVGFKSLLFAGLGKDDPRVRAAYKWIRLYWRLDSNPNMPRKRSREGLFYYYHAFAKALRAWGEPVIVDTKGVKHNWRAELIDALAKRVGKNGAWQNLAVRWGEKDPVLATAYGVLALEETLKK